MVERLSVQKISNPVWNMTNVLLGQYTHIWDVAKQKEDRELEAKLMQQAEDYAMLSAAGGSKPGEAPPTS